MDKLLDRTFFLIWLLYTSHVLLSPVDGQIVVEGLASSDGRGYLIPGIVQVPFLAYFMLRPNSLIAALPQLNTIIGYIFIFASLSTFWSIHPSFTVHSAIDLGLCIFFPAMAFRLLGPVECLRLIWILLSGLLIISCALAAVGSDYALMAENHEGLWRGVFDHKNVFGPFALSVFILSFIAGPLLGRGNLEVWLVRLLAVVAVAKSGSATAIVVAPLAIGVFALVWGLMRTRMSAGLITLSMVAAQVIGLLVIWLVFPIVLDLLDRDITLSGRLPIWEAAFPYTVEKPLGSGYGLSGGWEVLEEARLRSGWTAATSMHNGLLSMALDVGWIPVIGFVIWLIRSASIIVQSQRHSIYVVPALSAFAMTQLGLSITETTAGAYMSLSLFLVIAFSQWDPSMERRRQTSTIGHPVISP